MSFIEKIIFNILGGKSIESKLLKCQSYRAGSVPSWRSQTNLNILEAIKVLKKVEVFDGQRIREVINEILNNNKAIFNSPNVYITSFGSQGKSGGQIAYEFRHANLVDEHKFIEGWNLTKLPEGSTVIFVEDLIGTGTQSTEFILEKLNLLLNPSHVPYLLTICATPEGINKVESETNFLVINGITLTEEEYQHYSPQNTYFNDKEKNKLVNANQMLKKKGKRDYDKGLLVVFYYSPPNNTMPIIWKQGYPYQDNKANEKKWIALVPRQY